MSRVTIRRVGGLGRPIKGIYVDPLKHPDLEFIKKLVMLYRCTDSVQVYRCCTIFKLYVTGDFRDESYLILTWVPVTK